MSYSINEAAYCVEYFYAKPGCRDHLIKSLLNLIEATRAEKGCLQYDLIQDNQNPQLLILLVKFENKEMMSQHENQEFIKNFAENEMKQYCEKFTWNDGRGLQK